jgi:hypothetical protein
MTFGGGGEGDWSVIWVRRKANSFLALSEVEGWEANERQWNATMEMRLGMLEPSWSWWFDGRWKRKAVGSKKGR